MNDFEQNVKDGNDGGGSTAGSVKAEPAARRPAKRSQKKDRDPSPEAEGTVVFVSLDLRPKAHPRSQIIPC